MRLSLVLLVVILVGTGCLLPGTRKNDPRLMEVRYEPDENSAQLAFMKVEFLVNDEVISQDEIDPQECFTKNMLYRARSREEYPTVLLHYQWAGDETIHVVSKHEKNRRQAYELVPLHEWIAGE